MAKIGVVAGEKATRYFESEMFKGSDLEVTYKPLTLDRMIKDLTTSGLQFQELSSVLIVDYAFRDEGDGIEQTVAEKFVEIQDLMESNYLNTKLYLLTRNADLYDKLKGTVNGIPGTYYHGTQIIITKGDYKIDTIRSVVNGEYDNQFLYNKEVINRRNKEQRLRQEAEEEIERRRNVSEDILDFDKNTPTSKMSDIDYADTAKRKAYDENKRRNAEIKERENKRKGKKVVETEDEPEEERSGIRVNVQHPEENNSYSQEDLEDDEDILQNLFDKIEDGSGEYRSKLQEDNGVISFVGANDAGTSGLVANVADMYVMEGKKVLVIDLDFIKRMQSVYFKHYNRNTELNKGSSRALVDALQGFGIEDSAVKFTDKLSVLSISEGEEVGEDFIYALSGGIDTLLIEAKEVYDIVLLDVPNRYLRDFLHNFDEVDKNIFIIENKFYKLEDFITNYIHSMLEKEEEEREDSRVLEEFISKSDLIINKFKRGSRDLEGKEINKKYVRNVLDEVGYPYDRIGVAGEIPYYEDWEDQYHKGIRYVWIDDISLGVYRRVFDRVVV